ncbi:MAG: retention module-containing protein, partial [Sedimenticolaceae bacterium]
MAEQNATNSASSSIGEVQAVTGRVIAIGANGVERQLFAGDQIYPDDLIRTIGQGTIKVVLKDGTSFDLGQGAEALLDEAVHSSNVEALRAAAVAEAAEIQRAIAEGGDPTEIADPTAAGGGGAGTGESIENAVGIERTGRVGVVEAGFETGGLERGIEPVPVDPVYFGIGSDGAPAGGTEPAAPAPLPTLALTVSAPDDSNDNTPTITGTTDAGAGSTVSLTVTDSAGNVQNLTTTVQGDGSYSVEVPDALADGGYTVDASVTDMAGNTANASDPGSVVISNGINEVPVANADVDTTSENASITINVLSNDTDLDTSDTLMVAAVDVIGTKGSVINNGTDVRYDPGAAYDYLDVGESATDTFNYTISDGHGGTDTATVTVNITGSEDVSTITSATANLTETDAVLSTSG